MNDFYLYFLSAHIFSIIAWMVGLFYLPRLYVYHCDISIEDKAYTIFLTMEKRLLSLIMLPAMLSSWLFGLLLMISSGAFYQSGWLHTKIFLVLILSAFHGVLKIFYKQFLNKTNKQNSRFFRLINEIPTILLIAIILLVVFKPF